MKESKRIVTITCVEQVGQWARRYLIHLNGAPPLEVHEDIMLKFRLLKGSELSLDLLAEIWRADEGNKAYVQAIKYLQHKSRTRGEIARNLAQKGYEDGIVQEVLDQLERERWIDDKLYAMQWVSQRLNGYWKGRHWIQHELKQKQVKEPYIELALQAIDPDEEWNSARHAARKKWRQTKGDLHGRRQKVAAFLARRGYPTDMARRAADEQASEEEASGDIY